MKCVSVLHTMGLLYEVCRIVNCYNRAAEYVYTDIGYEASSMVRNVTSVTTVIVTRVMITFTNLYHDSELLVVPLYTSTQHLIQGQPTRGINGYCILSKNFLAPLCTVGLHGCKFGIYHHKCCPMLETVPAGQV